MYFICCETYIKIDTRLNSLYSLTCSFVCFQFYCRILIKYLELFRKLYQLLEQIIKIFMLNIKL